MHLRVGFGLDRPRRRGALRALHGRGAPTSSSPTAARSRASTATAARAALCWSASSARRCCAGVRRVQGALGPGRRRSTRASSWHPPPIAAGPARRWRRARWTSGRRRPTATTAATSARRGALHRCRALRLHAGLGAHVPELPRHARRAALDARPRAAAPGDDGRQPGRGGLALDGGARRARPLPLLPRLRLALPDERGHGHLQVGVPATTTTGDACGPLSHYSLGWLPLWLRLHRPRAPARQRRDALAPDAAALRAGGGHRRGAAPSRRSRARLVHARRGAGASAQRSPTPRRVAALPRAVGSCSGPTRSTTTSSPGGGPNAAAQVLEAAGFEVVVPGRTVCCGLTWHTTGSSTWPGGCCAARSRRPSWPARSPSSSSSPPAPRCSARTSSSSCRTTRGRLPWPRRVTTLAELLDSVGLRGARARPRPGAAAPAIAQPHCHQQAVLGPGGGPPRHGRATASLSAMSCTGCCGLAGNFGAERGHEAISRAVAELALLPALDARPGRARSWPTASAAGPRSRPFRAAAPATSPRSSPSASDLGMRRAGRAHLAPRATRGTTFTTQPVRGARHAPEHDVTVA